MTHLPRFLIFTVLCVLLNWSIPTGAINVVLGDWAFAFLETEKIRTGDWTAFFYRHEYGGLAFNYVRALWVVIWGWFDASDSRLWLSNMVLSFIVQPVLMMSALIFAASRYCGRAGLWVVSLLGAVGFQNWLGVYGNDFYVLHFLLACCFIAWRANLENPLLEWSKTRLFLMAACSGFAFYNFRAAILFFIPLFLPLPWATEKLTRLFQPRGRAEKGLYWTGWAFILLYFYLSLFGTKLGQLPDGRNLILSEDPNLKFALILWAVLAALQNKKELGLLLTPRAFLLPAGFFFGFLPEILHHALPHDENLYAANIHPTTLKEMFTNLLYLPSNLADLVGAGPGLGRNFSIVLTVWALFHLFRKNKTTSHLRPLALTGFLAILAYCSVSTYATGISRYLFHLFPVLILAIGILADHLWTRRTLVAWIFVTLLSGHALDQAWARHSRTVELNANPRKAHIEQVIADFRGAGIDFVFSDQYGDSNLYGLVSAENPVFVPPVGNLTPKRNVTRGKAPELRRAGFLLSSAPGFSAGKQLFEYDGQKWRLRPLSTRGAHFLFVGERE